MRVDLKLGECVAIATFTKKDFTTADDVSVIASMLCNRFCFDVLMQLEGTDTEIKNRLKPRVRYAILAHDFRRSSNDPDAADIHFGKEKELLKYLEKFK